MKNYNWAQIKKTIKKAMIDKDIGNVELGEAIHLSENYVCSVITGFIASEKARKKICDYLGIEYEA